MDEVKLRDILPTPGDVGFFRVDCHYLASDADLHEWRKDATWWQAQMIDAELELRGLEKRAAMHERHERRTRWRRWSYWRSVLSVAWWSLREEWRR